MMGLQGYILVIEESPTLIDPTHQSLTETQSPRDSKITTHSCDIFSFSEDKELRDRNDFDEDTSIDQEDPISQSHLHTTQAMQGIKYVGLLEGLDICLTARFREMKQWAFLEIRRQEVTLGICKLAMSNIAQERIIPFISQDILRSSRMAGRMGEWQERNPSPRARKKNVSLERIVFRLGMRMKKIQRMVLLRDAFNLIRFGMEEAKPSKISSLREIKRVESKGQLSQQGSVWRNNSLELRIISKYMRKMVVRWAFDNVQRFCRLRGIQQGVGRLCLHQSNLKRHFFHQILNNQRFIKLVQECRRLVSSTLNKLRYRQTLQAFYKIRSHTNANHTNIRGLNSLQHLLNKKNIKYTYGSFMRLKEHKSKEDKSSSCVKSSGMQGILQNFSLLLETKTRSITYESSINSEDSLFLRKTINRNRLGGYNESDRHTSIGMELGIGSGLGLGLGRGWRWRQERPVPPAVFALCSYGARSKAVEPDEIDEGEIDDGIDV